MANAEHVAVVLKGKDAIDEWRRRNPGARLDLAEADLAGAKLAGADLATASLSQANLCYADLAGANLSRANLTGANLAWATLTGADLSGARLILANLALAHLDSANLSEADLYLASLNWTNLSGVCFSQGQVGHTALSHLDLSQVTGLATAKHEAPSAVGVDTLIASFRGAGNNLTADLRSFFRSAGVPGELLEALPAIVAEVKYYGCFISYGQPDLRFAEKLRDDLVARGVSFWVYHRDATVGVPSWLEIAKARREADRMVVLCSAEGLTQPGLVKEIEEQVDEDPDKLVPVSLDDLWRKPGFRVVRDSLDLKPFLERKNYADFANLTYEEALQRLLAGLKRPSA